MELEPGLCPGSATLQLCPLFDPLCPHMYTEAHITCLPGLDEALTYSFLLLLKPINSTLIFFFLKTTECSVHQKTQARVFRAALVMIIAEILETTQVSINSKMDKLWYNYSHSGILYSNEE